jgi:hypothetical protein
MPAPDSVWRFFSTKKPDILSGFSGRRIQRELNFRIPGRAVRPQRHSALFLCRDYKNFSGVIRFAPYRAYKAEERPEHGCCHRHSGNFP